MALTKVTYSMIQGAVYNVLDFGADLTGIASSVTAFNAAVANGGTVYVPSGTYKLDGKVTIDQDNTTLWLAADVTLLLSGVAAVQSPFGNQIHVVANNCAVIGSGKSSLLQIDGSQSNALGLLHHAGFLVRDLVIDGDKANVTAITDDTFESGISIVCDSAQGAGFADAVIDNVEIRNFVQYGVNIFGDLARNVRITNCVIHDNGKASDANSVGAGIVATKRVFAQTYTNNVIYNNKSNGIICSSAGQTGANYTIANNIIVDNGTNGISFYEDTNYGSVNGQGLSDITVTGNVCKTNARSGIEFNASVGFLKDAAITGNVCNYNTLYGIAVFGQITPLNMENILLSNNDAKYNGTDNIFVNQYTAGVQGAAVPFTPIIEGSTSAGTGTYTTRSGSYTQIGNIIYFQLEATWSAHTGTGDLRVSGFPYAAINSEPLPTGWVWSNNLTITGQATFGLLGGQTYGNVGAINNGTYSAVALDTAATLRINGFYFVNE